jgi:hypothetical protein
MRAKTGRRHDGAKRVDYVCPSPPDGCGRTGRSAPVADAWVRDCVAHWLIPNGAADAALAAARAEDTPELAGLYAEQSRDRLSRDRLDDRLADGEFDDEYGRTDKAAYRRQCARLDERMTARQRQIDKVGASHALDVIPERGEDFMRLWDAADVHRRRELVSVFVERVVCAPTGPTNRVDLSKIQVIPSGVLDGAPDELLNVPIPAV